MQVKLKQKLSLTIEAGETVNVSAEQYKHIAQFVEVVKEEVKEEKTKSRKAPKTEKVEE